jgi:Domain of unknown function (DUF4148)
MSSSIDEAHNADRRPAASSFKASLLLSKEHEMKRFLIPAVVMASAIASSAVFAEPSTSGTTRAQVRAELAQARAAGVFDAADATYPAAQLRVANAPHAAGTEVVNADASAMGGTATGHSQSGRRTVSPQEARDSIYFGQ